ncbi:hypothetical protein BGZ54_004149 [Gamsiella multidivaricata]|nr:hypothetical protein BGZ54_004149 [Gamsiella multidivaricata]
MSSPVHVIRVIPCPFDVEADEAGSESPYIEKKLEILPDLDSDPERAKAFSAIPGFDDHLCLDIIRPYGRIFADKGLKYLLKRLSVGRGAIDANYLDEDKLPWLPDIQNKALNILTRLCEFVDKVSFGATNATKSEILAL